MKNYQYQSQVKNLANTLLENTYENEEIVYPIDMNYVIKQFNGEVVYNPELSCDKIEILKDKFIISLAYVSLSKNLEREILASLFGRIFMFMEPIGEHQVFFDSPFRKDSDERNGRYEMRSYFSDCLLADPFVFREKVFELTNQIDNNEEMCTSLSKYFGVSEKVIYRIGKRIGLYH